MYFITSFSPDNFPSFKSEYSRKDKWSKSHSVMSDYLRPHGLYSSWNSLGQNTGMGSCSLSRGYSQPRDWTQFCIAGRFFTNWAIRDALILLKSESYGGLKAQTLLYLLPLLKQKGKRERNTLIQKWMSPYWTLPFWMWGHLEIQAGPSVLEPWVAWDWTCLVSI